MKTEFFSKLLADTAADDSVLAVVVFGSYARESDYKDIDVCIFLYPDKVSMLKEQIKKYLKYVDEFDLHIFQDLPLYVKANVIKEGIILQNKDYPVLCDLYLETIHDFELFQPHYKTFLEAVKHG
nr:nucleotidyltransferase domain-containing protein [Candidatus Sigynarchaeota archaeon]